MTASVPAWLAALSTVAPVLSALGGYALAGRNEEARDKRAEKREAAGRTAAMSERLEEQRHSIQRDTLLELQDELQRYGRIHILGLNYDKTTLKERQQITMMPKNLSDDELQVGISIRRLNARVLNSELRKAVTNFTEFCTTELYIMAQFGEDKNVERALAALDQHSGDTARLYASLSDSLGEHLRAELDRRYLAGGA